MADRTVRTIYEAQVSGAEASLRSLAGKATAAAKTADDLTNSLKRAGEVKVSPTIDADIKAAEANVRTLTNRLKQLEAQPNSAKIDADIKRFEGKAEDAKRTLDMLARMEVTPKVLADTAKAKAQLDEARAKLKALEGMRAEVVAVADVDKARADLDRAQAQLKALHGAKAEMVVTVDSGKVKSSLAGMSKAAADEGDKAGLSAGKAIIDGINSTPIIGAAVGILGAMGIAGVAAFKQALQVDLREDLFGAKTGMDEATARKYGSAAAGAYANAWGETVESNLAAAEAARANKLIFDTDTQANIQKGIQQLQALAELTGGDVTETAEAAGNMIKNGLAKNATEAYDLMAVGIQQGLNRSDDLLDTLREYSPMFESIGLSGKDAMALMAQAMDDGARNTDFVADALKEFSIRAQDGAQTTIEAYQMLGLNAEEMGQKMAAGGDGAREGLDQVLDGLRAIEDPMARNAAGVALFGTKWEDLGNGSSVLAMNLDELGEAWDNTGNAAQTAMDRMQDNNATQIEQAWRGIKGALEEIGGVLASSLSPHIQSFTEYISVNRAEVMQWAADFGNGLFELIKGSIEFGAKMIEMGGTVATVFASIVEWAGKAAMAYGSLTNNEDMVKMGADLMAASEDMREFGETAETAAAQYKDSMIESVDATQAKFNEWSGGAIMQAKLSDAVTAMWARMDEFSAHVDASGGTVTINGNPVGAETALTMLETAINESDGTVTINGQTYPADDALDGLMTQINTTGGQVTIDANKAPADEKTQAAKMNADNTVGTMALDANEAIAERKRELMRLRMDGTIGVMGLDANDRPAEAVRNSTLGRINQSTGTLNIAGNDADARGKLNDLTRPRFGSVTINAAVTGLTSKLKSFFGLAHGGLVNPMGPTRVRGLAAGGYVPGPTPLPGKDNVLWPLAHGGQVLSQPLAGGEFVMNPVSTAMWGPMLEWMNKGGRPSDMQVQQASAPVVAAPSIDGATLLLQAGSEVAIAKIVRTGERKLTRG